MEPLENSGDSNLRQLAQSQDLEERAFALMELAHLARGTDNWVAARDYYGSALDVYSQLNNEAEVARASYSLGFSQARLGQHQDAVANLQLALERARELNDSGDIAYACGPLGDSLAKLGRLDEAAEVFGIAVTAYEDIGEPGQAGFACLSLGDLLMEQNRQSQAHEQFSRAYNLFQKAGDAFSAAVAKDMIALALTDLDQARDAGKLLDQALSVFEFLEAEERVAELHYRIGYTTNVLGYYSQAKSSLQVAARSFRKHNEFSRAALAEAELAKATLYSDLKAKNEAQVASLVRISAYFVAAGDQKNSLYADAILARWDMLREGFMHSAARRWSHILDRALEHGETETAQLARIYLAECELWKGVYSLGRELLADVDPGSWGDNARTQAEFERVSAIALEKPVEDEPPVERCPGLLS